MTDTRKLYMLKDEEAFGYIIGQTSDNHVVFEHTDGEVQKVLMTSLERVMPYTVDIEFFSITNQVWSKRYSYFCNSGDVHTGDLLIMPEHRMAYARVADIDTKSDSATRWLHAYVVAVDEVNATEARVNVADDDGDDVDVE